MKDKIEVRKIDIKIGDKTISLKPEQAKELKKILNEMFEEKVVHEHHHEYHRYWWNWPAYTQPYTPYPQWTITCGGSGLANGTSTDFSGGAVSLCLNAA